MFGFIASPCPRCTAGTLPVWRGAFCGLARCLGRDYGQAARLLVNRDATFLALLGLSLDPAPPDWKAATCCNPFARPFPVDDGHPAVRHAAAVSVCGLAVKLADDASDEGPLRRGTSKLGALLSSHATNLAVARLNSSGFPTGTVLDRLRTQEHLESTRPERADEPTAHAFGDITAHLAVLIDRPALHAPLRRCGSALGALVYWRDAWDDRIEDGRRGRFNPFACLASTRIRERVAGVWNEFQTSLATLPFVRHPELIAGLQGATQRHHASFLAIIDEDSQEDRKKRRKRERKNRCWDSCDCCTCCDCPMPGTAKGGCCDAACDCGPGDTGCCDCNPCDGCSCH